MEPVKLKIKNFYAMTDGEIDFTTFSSALILGYYENNVLMSNGAGKSTIFEAICWVVFNETRQTKVDDVIRWSANEATVEFEFIFDRKQYKIIRRRSRISKESSVSLFTKEGSSWVNDSGSINSETNKKILALLKIDTNIFLNSVYFKQHDISLFANSSPSDRKEIIKSIIKLERWDEYQKQAKSKLKTIKDDIEKHQRVLNENTGINVQHISIEKSIEMINEELASLYSQQKHHQDNLKDLLEMKKEKSLTALVEQYVDVKNCITQLKTQGKKLQLKQVDFSNDLEEVKSERNQYNQQITVIEKILVEANEKVEGLKREKSSYKELEDVILSQRVEKNQLENVLSNLQETSSLIGIGQCQVCFTEINADNISHIHSNREDRRIQAETSFANVSKQLTLIEKEYRIRRENSEKLNDLLNKLEVCGLKLNKLQMQKQSAEDKIVYVDNEIIVIDASMKNIMDDIFSLKIKAEGIEKKIEDQKLHNIDDEIYSIEESIRQVLRALNNKSMELGSLIKEQEFISVKLASISIANEMITKLAKEKVSYDQLVRYFGKEGIQAVFIESVVDELEQYANDTLSYICNEPTIIKLRTQKKTGDNWQETLEIDVIMNGISQTFESLGGGERFRISLALRIGLSEVLVKRAGGEIKLLLLDEVDSPLDAYGSQNLFENIIKGLEKRFKIMVISHNDKLKDRFDDIIMVNKTTKGSYILQA